MTQIKNLESRKAEIDQKELTEKGALHNYNFTSEYLNYLNAIQLILSSSLLKMDRFDYFKNSNVQIGGAFSIQFDNGQFRSSGIPSDITSIYYNGRHISSYSPQLPISSDSRIIERIAVDKRVFSTCFEDFNKIINNTEAIQILSQINGALSEYKNLNFTQAFIQVWFVIEFFINKKWVHYLGSKHKTFSSGEERINVARNKVLADFKIAFISNQLELNDCITYEQFKTIDILRKKRNSIVHNIYESHISYNDCFDAFGIIIDFVKAEYDVDLLIGGSISYSTF